MESGKRIKLYKFFVAFNLFLIILVVGYCIYGDFQNRIAYQNCVKQQSLDVTKQEAISDYCFEMVREGGFRE